MFGPVLKFVRALLCAVSLMLIGVGAHAVRADSGGGDGRAEWNVRKVAKPTPALSARVGAMCPLALAVAQGGAPRSLALTPAGKGFSRLLAAVRETKTARSHRKAERQAWPRARSGVVRLLI